MCDDTTKLQGDEIDDEVRNGCIWILGCITNGSKQKGRPKRGKPKGTLESEIHASLCVDGKGYSRTRSADTTTSGRAMRCVWFHQQTRARAVYLGGELKWGQVDVAVFYIPRNRLFVAIIGTVCS